MQGLKWTGWLAAGLLALPALAHAEWAYAAKDINLRAGPATDYPVVARLGAGVTLSVEGCLNDYRWCDVVAGPYRGWVYAGNIVYSYQGRRVPVRDIGAAIGLGIVLFSLGNYWDQHYRNRPWYPQRQLWIDRPRPHFGPDVHHRPVTPPNPGFGNGRPHPPGPPSPQFRPGNQRPSGSDGHFPTPGGGGSPRPQRGGPGPDNDHP